MYTDNFKSGVFCGCKQKCSADPSVSLVGQIGSSIMAVRAKCPQSSKILQDDSVRALLVKDLDDNGTDICILLAQIALVCTSLTGTQNIPALSPFICHIPFCRNYIFHFHGMGLNFSNILFNEFLQDSTSTVITKFSTFCHSVNRCYQT